MTKLQARVIVLLLAAILLALVAMQFGQRSAGPAPTQPIASNDGREPVQLDPQQLDYSLAQMRGLLAGLNEYDRAIGNSALAALADLAARHGPGAGKTAPAGLHDAQPANFRALSATMRQAFATMEKAARAGDLAGVRSARETAGNACVACHESYRFEPKPVG
ncbi:cytochrome c [Novosphingobium sp.]|uniref:cytochrome c n=1 Tax=Novosphingobium sp. TaxID=1874826 RepID=UPI00273695C2|nr:cytochrome c [Novosphingobium sp.]MDP3908682.1 cytochrome c [Novosphingobium sp.]